MSVTTVVEGIIDIIKENLIAKTNAISNVLTGQVVVNVENAFHFSAGDEVVLIDYGYNDEASPHYQKYEYCVVKEVNNTYALTLEQPIVDTTGWLVSNGAFVQKTIGHAPLYDDRVFYGDREVIPTEEMAVTVEPNSLSNEWIYIQGGLSNEYRISIMIYGKDIETEEGMKILNMYTDVLYDLFNKNIHIDINNYNSPMLSNVAAGSFTAGLGTLVVVQNTADNRINFIPSYLSPDDMIYEIQDNVGTEIDLFVTSVDTTTEPGKMRIYVSKTDPTMTGSVKPLQRSYNIKEYAVFKKHGRYFYDSRIDNIEYGMVQKGSAFLRAARLNWFGKEVQEIKFPQRSYKIPYFPVVSGTLVSSSSSSSSSIDSSSSSSSSNSSSSSSIDSSSSSSSG